MGRWSAWKAFLIIALAGVAPACCAYISYHRIGTAGQMIALAATPTGFFLFSLLASAGSVKMQQAVAISAGLAGGSFVIALLIYLACGGARGHAMGIPDHAILLLGVWLLGAALSIVITIIAVAKSLMAEVKRPAKTPDTPSESN